MQHIALIFGVGIVIGFGAVGGWLATRVANIFSTKRIPFWTAFVICAIVAAWTCIATPATPLLPITLLLGWMLFVAATIDALEFRLPNLLTIPLIVTGLVVTAIVFRQEFLAHLVGAALGYAVFAGFAWAYRKVRGRDGLGLGDTKLIAGGGAWLGWEALPSVVLIASVAGLLWFGAMAIARGRDALAERMPFGVPLCFAIWIVWLYGPLTGLIGPA